MTDLHERFAAWLTEGVAGDPPRDVAVHASGCAECLARATAIEDLRTIDIGAAELPPVFAGRARAAAWLTPAGRWAAGASTLALVALAVALLAGNPFGSRQTGAASGAEEPAVVAEGVLGTAGSAPSSDPTPSAAETSTPRESATPSATPESTADAPIGQAPPGTGGGPVATPAPIGPTVPVGTPRPSTSAAPTPSPAPPSASASAAPTPTPPPPPTAAPTPTPTPTPSPLPTTEPTPGEESSARSSDCANGIDDDGDTLTDVLDPGCFLGSREADL